ncbi:alpha/beta fold hydrolase [Nitrospirillum iridis]|uniref:Pimeloyl-ACP methyl ester carboxylesterase n=1 Tax=Nitrospirillum iridis TaxID=765888 RepID=A0A7X0EDS1_9PROT|nr:alpha/beta fold hydrolase [Nitrospirillum iridis]MBB6253092.1 pimeloyl-ACP methyl ester carboxylesterase [Nitrospirillum iridis]
MGVRIARGYVRTRMGEVHYRRAGAGPAVVLLHDSPRSSLLHLPLLRALGDRFTVFALDTPGYGASTPLDLGRAPVIADFAEALELTLSALGIGRAAFYACHTGSKILLDFAVRWPARVGVAVLDGLSIPAGDPAGGFPNEGFPNEGFIERYMRPFELDAEGAWLGREWTRVKDTLRWFPWFTADQAGRMPIDLPPLEDIQAYCLDYFMAGPHYADAYRAAMRHNPLDNVARAVAPVVYTARADDVLFSHLDRLPPHRRIDRLPADRTVWLAAIGRHLAAAAGTEPYREPAGAEGPGPSRFHAGLPHGQIRLHRFGRARDRRPLLWLHDPPGGAAADGPLLSALGRGRLVLAPDLPGCGQSDPLPDPGLAAYVDALAGLLDVLAIGMVDIAAEGMATPIALALMAAHPGRVGAAILDGAVLADDAGRDDMARRYCPPLVLSGGGAHWHEAWHLLRDREAQFPWYGSGAASIRHRTPDLAAGRLRALLLDVMAQPARYGDAVHAAVSRDVRPLLPGLGHPVLLCADSGDPRQGWSHRAAADLSHAIVRQRPATPEERARLYLDFLERASDADS